MECGFLDIRALEISLTDQNEQHGSGLGYYYQIQKNIGSGRWRVLCANCNAIAKFNAAVPVDGPKQMGLDIAALEGEPILSPEEDAT